MTLPKRSEPYRKGETALMALQADRVVTSWIAPATIETFLGVKQAEIAQTASLDAAATCALYGTLY